MRSRMMLVDAWPWQYAVVAVAAAVIAVIAVMIIAGYELPSARLWQQRQQRPEGSDPRAGDA